MSDAPLFEVTSPIITAAARRLTTAAKVQAVLFGGATTDTALIETLIDRVSASAARYCNIASDPAGVVPTLGRETCRATWRPLMTGRGCMLLLPWRFPVTTISEVVEDGVSLDAGNYELRAGAMLERLNDDGIPVPWSSASIVVTYVVGWDLTQADTVAPDVEAAVIDQVKAMYHGRARDPALRSEATESVGSASYSVPGGDSIAKSGLMSSVEAALDDLRARPV